jgi:branched-chain amino acid aminotransferase
MAQGTQHSVDDPRNAGILIWINGALTPRDQAMVSVFDSGFVLGDGVWEGFRVAGGQPLFLDAHLDRLYEGAKALMLNIGLDRAQLTRAILDTLDANDMHGDGVHVRLMVTRGVKRTPYQDPRVVVGPATIVIIPEYKTASIETAERGITLFTVHVRRGYPDVQDPKLNCITACIQANTAGADEALMLDPHGFVGTGHSTHFFIVRKGEVWTSTGE